MTPRLAPLIAALVVAAPMASALTASDRAGIDARYQRERQACASVADPDSRHACLRDAGAARQEALRGTLTGREGDAAQWQRNALLRCTVHKDVIDRALCERMAQGEGQASGSVEGGGVIREIEVEIDPDPTNPR